MYRPYVDCFFLTFHVRILCFSLTFHVGKSESFCSLSRSFGRYRVIVTFGIFAVGAQSTEVWAAGPGHFKICSVAAPFTFPEIFGSLEGSLDSCPSLFSIDLSIGIKASWLMTSCSGSFWYCISGWNFLAGIMQAQILLISD